MCEGDHGGSGTLAGGRTAERAGRVLKNQTESGSSPGSVSNHSLTQEFLITVIISLAWDVFLSLMREY